MAQLAKLLDGYGAEAVPVVIHRGRTAFTLSGNPYVGQVGNLRPIVNPIVNRPVAKCAARGHPKPPEKEPATRSPALPGTERAAAACSHCQASQDKAK